MRFRNDCSRGYAPKLVWYAAHFLGVALLLGLDQQLILACHWYIILYLLLFVIVIVQYIWVAGSSPGYVVDQDQAALVEAGIKAATPLQSGRCTFCRAVQPLRTKHCHDCDKCVLRFDHHCVWLGTCIGQRNHRRFWWYVFLETVLCVWTAGMYIVAYHRLKNESPWMVYVPLLCGFILLLTASMFLGVLFIFHSYLALTNQTTYEKTRRRRISYLKDLPPDVQPFNKGMISNLYEFCCQYESTEYEAPLLGNNGSGTSVGDETSKTGRWWCCWRR